ncbi:MAG: hypothetical protein ACC608_03880 [Anaerofustis sp.]
MTKTELIKKIKTENLDKTLLPWLIVFDEITDSPDVIGCVHEGGKWKIFKTVERGGHYIIKELDNEEDAYDYFYNQLLYQKRLNSY